MHIHKSSQEKNRYDERFENRRQSQVPVIYQGFEVYPNDDSEYFGIDPNEVNPSVNLFALQSFEKCKHFVERRKIVDMLIKVTLVMLIYRICKNRYECLYLE